jgi:peptidoglycan L-alanyl-D-glutamate endopeptidase CwlK
MTRTQIIQDALNLKPDDIWGAKTDAAVAAEKLASQQRHSPGSPAVASREGGSPAADEPLDPRSEKNIATLHRKLQPIARQLVKLAADNDLTIQILSGTRTYAEQDALYNGPGHVTKARGGYSNHNFGVAFDTGIFVDGKYIDDEYEKKRFSGAEMERLYTKLAGLAKSLGLSWGGDWKNFQDQPHFELHPPWAAHMDEGQMLAELRRRHDEGTDAFA